MNKCVLFFRCSMFIHNNKLCGRLPQYDPAPCKLTFWPCKWCPSPVPILVFIGLSVVDLGPMYVTDRQTDVRRASSLNFPYLGDIVIWHCDSGSNVPSVLSQCQLGDRNGISPAKLFRTQQSWLTQVPPGKWPLKRGGRERETFGDAA